MAEFRKDPVLDRWVLISEERAARPQEFVERAVVHRAGVCPFCEGSEAATPHEIVALRKPGTLADSPGWDVRVVPNRYPAVSPPDSTTAGATGACLSASHASPEAFVFRQAEGVHEVIIEAAEHVTTAGRLSDRQTADVFKVYQARLQNLRARKGMRYVQIFRNVGEAAGASIEHLHSQVIGLDLVPGLVAEELAAGAAYYRRTGQCAYCAYSQGEEADKTRVVETTDDFLLVCPYASRFPYEMCLIPRCHQADFDHTDAGQLAQAAGLMRRGLARLEQLCETPAYNCVLHTAPFDRFAVPHYHWHLEILPRLVQAAGFEWGTGIHINPVSPERAAASLRGIQLTNDAEAGL